MRALRAYACRAEGADGGYRLFPEGLSWPLWLSAYCLQRKLGGTARTQTDAAHPQGCLVSLSGVNGTAPGTPVAAALAAERDRTSAGILACVRRAVERGELNATIDVTGLASLIHGFLAGISLWARDGESAAAIERGIDALLQAWGARRPAAG